MKNSRFGFKDGDLESIVAVLQSKPGIQQALIFGSRAKGNYKMGSDVDIALKGNIDFRTISDINFDLNENTCLPYQFDIVHYESINNQEFKHHIDRVGIVVYPEQTEGE